MTFCTPARFVLPLMLLVTVACAEPPRQEPPEQPHLPAIVEGEVGKRVDELLQAYSAFGFSGAVLVARDGKILLRRGYGMADEARGIAVVSDTLFDIASAGKQFTAAAILTLEQQDLLAVEDSIGRHLDGLPPDKVAITVHQLLTHTSGLPSDIAEEVRTLSRDEFLRRLAGTPLDAPPGSEFGYSNAGYALLAIPIEEVSGDAPFPMDRIGADSAYHRFGIEFL